MKLVYLTVIICHLLIGLNVAICGLPRETGCPPPEDVEPCKCETFTYVNLVCRNIQNADVLRLVFENSARYSYVQVNLENSSIQYLPHEMFDHARVFRIALIDVTLVKLFDEPPQSLDKLQSLVIKDTKVLSGMNWELFQNFTQLRRLSIYHTPVKTINSGFSKYVTKSLQIFDFVETQTRRLNPGILSEFLDLEKIMINNCKLTELTRNMFPVPYIGRDLEFHDNSITSISNDLFTQMPNLDSLDLSNNQIATILESAFGGSIDRLDFVFLDGNPLKCDCLLVWFIRNKPNDEMSGSCTAPKRLQGRHLRDLSPEDFNC